MGEEDEAAAVVEEPDEEDTGAPPTAEAVARRIEADTVVDLEAIEVGEGHLIVAVVVVAGAVVGAEEGPSSQGIVSPPTPRSKIPRTNCFRVCHK